MLSISRDLEVAPAAWQRGLVAAVTVSPDQACAEQILQLVEREAALVLGPLLVDATTEWLA